MQREEFYKEYDNLSPVEKSLLENEFSRNVANASNYNNKLTLSEYDVHLLQQILLNHRKNIRHYTEEVNKLETAIGAKLVEEWRKVNGL